ncbi:unnamed protein product [Cylindrotheca closterium]|uniref:Glutaredoxin-like protein n=1 Tax=Cylindrotheca closterium TaxID=2856 RepID=A0AAD2FTX4_9STRA|nr:unnamed protein product [Cylindrotheca closterium]
MVFLAACIRALPSANAFLVRPNTRAPIGAWSNSRCFASVTGNVYTADAKDDSPTVRLFTKEGCTLCDKVKDVLIQVREEFPHNLDQIDITDSEHKEWFDKYKYDIPVLHMETKFWIKHRMTLEEAREGIQEAMNGAFGERKGDPNAAAYERN